MKALTICQPYAHLVCLPVTDPRHKRVENRTWETKFRGRLYIHAGKSREWLDDEEEFSDDPRASVNYGIPVASMAFGAVVGLAVLLDCLPVEDIQAGKYDAKYPWLREHQHTEGPWCWVLAEEVMPVGPWTYKGAQGLFEINPENLTRPYQTPYVERLNDEIIRSAKP